MDASEFQRISDRFRRDGYVVVSLSQRSVLDAAREELAEALRAAAGRDVTFYDYHQHVSDPQQHLKVQSELSEFVRARSLCRRIVASELVFFRLLLGPDLAVQRLPYLRIARPDRPEDNVDYHRDTQYGRSPWELSVWIPFTEVSEEMALRVIPGSHTAPESDFPTIQSNRLDVVRGGSKHKLGFPYAPKTMDDTVEPRTRPIPVAYGEIIVFSLSLVHGQRCNRSSATRFTADTRVVHALAPIEWQASVSGDYYEPLSRGAVTAQALDYARNNHQDSRVGPGLVASGVSPSR